MATSPQKRQKKLEKRKAKQRAEKREVARRESLGMAYRLEQTAAAPILHCCVADTLWDEGLGNVLVSRLLSDGRVAFAVFLVDRYCLGVKYAFANIAPRAHYEQGPYRKLVGTPRAVALTPEAARKLVESAVAYARDLGFSPHPDYHVAKAIFGDVSAEACAEEFEFGSNGKPLFIAGPNDDSRRCREITRTLTARLGNDGFHFLVPLHGPAEDLDLEPDFEPLDWQKQTDDD